MDFFTQNGGPLALQAIDGLKEDSGAEIELNDGQDWSRGEVCQIGKPGLTEMTGGFQSIDGMFGHAGVPSAVDVEVEWRGSAFFGVHTSTTTPENSDGSVFVKGFVYANILIDDAETLTAGQTLYVVDGQTYLVTAEDPTITGPGLLSTGRAVAVCMETVANPENNVARLTKVLFNGIPHFLG